MCVFVERERERENGCVALKFELKRDFAYQSASETAPSSGGRFRMLHDQQTATALSTLDKKLNVCPNNVSNRKKMPAKHPNAAFDRFDFNPISCIFDF